MERKPTKTLKFRPYLVEPILNGTKVSTWRLFDDKDLQVGDNLDLLNSETKEKFAEAEVIDIQEKSFNHLTEADLKGYEGFKGIEEIVKYFQKYYGDRVTMTTSIKIVNFKIKNTNGVPRNHQTS